MVATTAVPDRSNRFAAPVMWRHATTLPMTVAVVGALLGVTAFLDTHPGDVDTVVAWASTNVHNLAAHPVAAMVTSAFVTPGRPWVELILVAVGCAVAERTLGSRRTLVVALAGQVIATLMTEYGAAIASSLRLVVFSSPDRADVGISYVMYALLGAAAWVLPARLRIGALAVLAAAVVIPLAVDPGMTTTGHVLSLASGVAAAARPFRRGSNTLPGAGRI